MNFDHEVFKAIADNDVDILKKIIEQGADVNARDPDGNTPLVKACEKDRDPALGLTLLEHGAEVNVDNKYCGTPLMFAVFWKRTDLVKALLERGAKVNIAGALDKCMASMTPLGNAVLDGSLEIVNCLLDAGADVNTPDGAGRTPIYFAATVYHSAPEKLQLLKLLLDRKADVNLRAGYDRRTPLMEACRYPLTGSEAIQALLDAGADVNAEDKEGNTALHFALTRGMGPVNHDMIRLLVEKGARIDVANRQGDTPLVMALKMKDREPARILKNSRTDINAADGLGNTLLHNAIMHRLGMQLVSEYISGGGDINRKNNDGMTALMLCAKTGWIEPAKKLVEHGVDVNACDRDGNSALLHAVLASDPSIELVMLLLDKGAEVNIKNNCGESAIIISSGGGYRHLKIVEMLLTAGADENDTDKDGNTPLIYAVENTDEDMTRLLLNCGADPNKSNSSGRSAINIAESRHTDARELCRKDDDFERNVVDQREAIVRILSEYRTDLNHR